MSSPINTLLEMANLPDGTQIQVLNGYEASFVIDEIFHGNAYPINLREGSPSPVIIVMLLTNALKHVSSPLSPRHRSSNFCQKTHRPIVLR
jgi:hypothetical protein